MALVTTSVMAAAGAAGCESTRDKSARLEREGRKAFQAKGLVVTRPTGQVDVAGTAVVHDENGTAVVVSLRSRAARPIAGVPIAIDVLGAAKASVFRNDAPGLEPSLVGVSVLPPRSAIDWVHDQVAPSGPARSVAAKVGDPRGEAPPRLPDLAVSQPTLSLDPVSGIEANGAVTNRSGVEQRALVVYCVARRGRKVVAAGRGQIQRLKPGRRVNYHIFFIGNPRGARLSVTAPPTVLQ